MIWSLLGCLSCLLYSILLSLRTFWQIVEFNKLSLILKLRGEGLRAGLLVQQRVVSSLFHRWNGFYLLGGQVGKPLVLTFNGRKNDFLFFHELLFRNCFFLGCLRAQGRNNGIMSLTLVLFLDVVDLLMGPQNFEVVIQGLLRFFLLNLVVEHDQVILLLKTQINIFFFLIESERGVGAAELIQVLLHLTLRKPFSFNFGRHIKLNMMPHHEIYKQREI